MLYNKYKVMLSLLLLLSITFLTSACGSKQEDVDFSKGEIILEDYLNEFKVTNTEKAITTSILEEGCIRNETYAIEVANSIMKSVYGEGFDNDMPLWANYDNKKQVWLVKTQLPNGFDGGNKYIILKKSNAEVIAIWATK